MVDVQELRRLFTYDPDTGVITNKTDRGTRARAGQEAGNIGKAGYRDIRVEGKNYRGHRIAWALYHGEWPPEGMWLDHINRVRSDNRLLNLRLVTTSQNQMNRGARVGSDLPVGVHKCASGFIAQIGVRYRKKYLGTFSTPEAAHAAYLDAKAELHVI